MFRSPACTHLHSRQADTLRADTARSKSRSHLWIAKMIKKAKSPSVWKSIPCVQESLSLEFPSAWPNCQAVAKPRDALYGIVFSSAMSTMWGKHGGSIPFVPAPILVRKPTRCTCFVGEISRKVGFWLKAPSLRCPTTRAWASGLAFARSTRTSERTSVVARGSQGGFVRRVGSEDSTRILRQSLGTVRKSPSYLKYIVY